MPITPIFLLVFYVGSGPLCIAVWHVEYENGNVNFLKYDIKSIIIGIIIETVGLEAAAGTDACIHLTILKVASWEHKAEARKLTSQDAPKRNSPSHIITPLVRLLPKTLQ